MGFKNGVTVYVSSYRLNPGKRFKPGATAADWLSICGCEAGSCPKEAREIYFANDSLHLFTVDTFTYSDAGVLDVQNSTQTSDFRFKNKVSPGTSADGIHEFAPLGLKFGAGGAFSFSQRVFYTTGGVSHVAARSGQLFELIENHSYHFDFERDGYLLNVTPENLTPR